MSRRPSYQAVSWFAIAAGCAARAGKSGLPVVAGFEALRDTSSLADQARRPLLAFLPPRAAALCRPVGKLAPTPVNNRYPPAGCLRAILVMAGAHLKESLFPGAPCYNLLELLDRLRTWFQHRDGRNRFKDRSLLLERQRRNRRQGRSFRHGLL